MRQLIEKIAGGRDLSAGEMSLAVDTIIDGAAPTVQVAGLLIGLKIKGESASELIGAAAALRARAVPALIDDKPVLDVVGTSKGRGFTGVMKRYNYAGSDAGHGTHEAFRNVGTGGQGSATPGRVPKGKRRPGQYGNARNTKQNILIQFVDPDNRLIYLKGGIPGPNGGMVELREASKTPDP